MKDGRANNGGSREGAGRKKKEDEQLLINLLSPFDQLYIDTLIQNIKEGESWAVKEFSNRRWGKVRESQQIDMNLNSFSLKDMDSLTHEERLEALKDIGL